MTRVDTGSAQFDAGEHGVIVESFGDRKVLLTASDALALARLILETFCQTCERGDVAVNDAGECADCARNRAQRNGE